MYSCMILHDRFPLGVIHEWDFIYGASIPGISHKIQVINFTVYVGKMLSSILTKEA